MRHEPVMLALDCTFEYTINGAYSACSLATNPAARKKVLPKMLVFVVVALVKGRALKRY